MPRAMGALEGEVGVVELFWEPGRTIKVFLSKTSWAFYSPPSTQAALWHHLCTWAAPPHPTPHVVVWPGCYALTLPCSVTLGNSFPPLGLNLYLSKEMGSYF